jgi:hypothetical protein
MLREMFRKRERHGNIEQHSLKARASQGDQPPALLVAEAVDE